MEVAYIKFAILRLSVSPWTSDGTCPVRWTFDLFPVILLVALEAESQVHDQSLGPVIPQICYQVLMTL